MATKKKVSTQKVSADIGAPSFITVYRAKSFFHDSSRSKDYKQGEVVSGWSPDRVKQYLQSGLLYETKEREQLEVK